MYSRGAIGKIQPDNNVGNCWAYAGHQGHITIALSEPVAVTGVSIAHIPYALKRRDSAPKDFEVVVCVCWG